MKLSVLLMCLALSFAGSAWAAPHSGDRELVLSGGGSSDKDFDSNSYSLSGQMGWFLSDNMEVGARQSLSGIAQDRGEDSWSANTRGFFDYHFGTGAVKPFVGANLGYIYGDAVTDTGTAGVEGGAKFFVKDSTFIMLLVEYQFLFDDADKIDNRFNNGAFFYSLGVGFTF